MKLKNPPLNIDRDDPFKEDKLGRDKNIEALTQLLTSSEDSFVLAVNSPWGGGKTTFIKMWIQYLKNRGFPVIYFNAWENDFTDNALVSLMGEIGKGIEEIDISKEKNKLVKKSFKKAKKIGSNLIKLSVPLALKAATLGILDIKNEDVEKTLSDFSEKVAANSIKEYEESRKTIDNLKKELKEFAGNISSPERDEESNPLIIFIDELDRCRPTYAIEILEKVKHIFDVPFIIFVLGVDKEQLGHSIQSVYGEKFLVEGYLKRFIDITYDLPTPDKGKFLEYLVARFGILNDWKNRKANIDSHGLGYINIILSDIFEHFNYSLRHQEQFIAHLNIIIRTHSAGSYIFIDLLIFLLVLKNIDLNLYKKFINYEFTIEEVLKFTDVFPKDSTRINNFLKIVEIDLYLALENNMKFIDGIRKKLDEYRSLTQDKDIKKQGEAESFLNLHSHRNFRYNIDLDLIIKKIELLDNLKIGE
ncbi:P-loop NTPase fold protein [Acidobacteriota bacterium]